MSRITNFINSTSHGQLITDFIVFLIIFLIGICLFDFRSGKKSGKTRERGEFLFLNDA